MGNGCDICNQDQHENGLRSQGNEIHYIEQI